MFSGAQHIYQSQNKCSMNDCENVYQVLRDFRNDINKLKHSLRQLQKKVLGDGAYNCLFFKIVHGCEIFSNWIFIDRPCEPPKKCLERTVHLEMNKF